MKVANKALCLVQIYMRGKCPEVHSFYLKLYMLLRTNSAQNPSTAPTPTVNTVPPSGRTTSNGPFQSAGTARLLAAAARLTFASSLQLAEYAAIHINRCGLDQERNSPASKGFEPTRGSVGLLWVAMSCSNMHCCATWMLFTTSLLHRHPASPSQLKIPCCAVCTWPWHCENMEPKTGYLSPFTCLLRNGWRRNVHDVLCLEDLASQSDIESRSWTLRQLIASLHHPSFRTSASEHRKNNKEKSEHGTSQREETMSSQPLFFLYHLDHHSPKRVNTVKHTIA